MIAEYMQRLQRILGDTVFQRFNPDDLLTHINSARLFVASEAECCRVLVPSTAGISAIQITNGGSGYTTAPTVSITPPNVGTGATATAFVSGGAVIFIQVTSPGSGYSAPTLPGVSFSGGGGTGAAASVTLQPYAQTILGQELYNFSSFNPLIQGMGQGFGQIISLNSIAVSWGSMKPTLRRYDWGEFQARLRAYNVGAQGFPRAWSLFGQGSQGSFYLWPIPYQVAQMDLDAVVTPADLDLTNDSQPEPIPKPWTLAVPYKAAQNAVMGHRDLADRSKAYEAQYMSRMMLAGASGRGQSFIPDYY